MSRPSWTSPFQPKPYDGYILELRNMDERGRWEASDITQKLNALGEKLQTSDDKLSSSWKLVGARPVIVILLRKYSIEVELGRTKNAKRDFSEWYLKEVVTCHWERAEDRENPGPRVWTIKATKASRDDDRGSFLASIGICSVEWERTGSLNPTSIWANSVSDPEPGSSDIGGKSTAEGGSSHIPEGKY